MEREYHPLIYYESYYLEFYPFFSGITTALYFELSIWKFQYMAVLYGLDFTTSLAKLTKGILLMQVSVVSEVCA